jgi:hypothetical protein
VNDRSKPSYGPVGTRFLLASALLGALLAASGYFKPGERPLPAQAIASVDGEIIGRDEYLLLLSQVNTDRRSAMTARERDRLLDRMIEERLLIQRSLKKGLPRANDDIRTAIVDSVLEMAASNLSGDNPLRAEQALQQYLKELRAVADINIYRETLARHVSPPR